MNVMMICSKKVASEFGVHLTKVVKCRSTLHLTQSGINPTLKSSNSQDQRAKVTTTISNINSECMVWYKILQSPLCVWLLDKQQTCWLHFTKSWHPKETLNLWYVKWPGICPHQRILGHSYHEFMDKEKLEDRQN